MLEPGHKGVSSNILRHRIRDRRPCCLELYQQEDPSWQRGCLLSWVLLWFVFIVINYSYALLSHELKLSSGTKIQASALLYLVMQGRHEIPAYEKIKSCCTNRTINKNRLRTLRNSIKIISRCGFREVSQNMNRGEDRPWRVKTWSRTSTRINAECEVNIQDSGPENASPVGLLVFRQLIY